MFCAVSCCGRGPHALAESQQCTMCYQHCSVLSVLFYYGVCTMFSRALGEFQSAERASTLPVRTQDRALPIYPGRAPFWARRDARRNLGVRVRLIRAVSTRRTTQSCIDPAFFLGRTDRVGASGDRRRRKVLRPDCPPKSNARSSPDQMACCMPSPDVASAARTVVLGPILGITLFSSRPN